MIYTENIYLCLSAPLLVACLCCHKELQRSLIFVLCGMTSCILSAYINLFFAQIYDTSLLTATIEISPVIEEIMKLLPILFYLLVFQPTKKAIFSSMLMIALGFATFENICYLVAYGAENLPFLLIRGFGAGAMHIACGAIVGYGLLFTWNKKWLTVMGTFGLLCIAIIFHGQYNLLMASGQPWNIVGGIMPIGTILTVKIVRKAKQTSPFSKRLTDSLW